jgi:hypothetical protein
MQSDVPPLPISCLTANLRVRRFVYILIKCLFFILDDKLKLFFRNSNIKSGRTAQASTNNLLCKSRHSALLSSNKKKLCPIIGL